MSLPDAALAALPRTRSWIGGREVEGRAGLAPATDPATGEPFAAVERLDAEQAGAAFDAARAAFPAWSATPVRARARALDALRAALLAEAEQLARLVSREQGKPVAEAWAAEILPSLDALAHLAEHAEAALQDEPVQAHSLLQAHKQARIVRVPCGVVLAITPWNFPLALPLPIVATALAAGNTVVLKPAPAGVLTGLRIGALARRAGLPDGVVNVLATDDAVAAALAADPRPDKIVFVGSTATGRKVMTAAAANLTPVVLELGGKDPAIVCRDADLDRAAQGIAWGAFVNAGQTCASVERVFVEQAVAEPFLAQLVERTRALRVGDPGRAGTDLGPLTLARQRTIVVEQVEEALRRGARCLTGGAAPDGPGHFFPPTVLAGVDPAMRVMREETFGPVLPVMSVPSPYGLTASGWTRSEAIAARLQRELQAGVVTINDCVASFAEPAAPWGGIKASGIGSTHGRLGLLEMTQPKFVSLDRGRGAELWWYPYDRELEEILATTAPALHARTLRERLAAQLRLLARRRVRERVGLRRLLGQLEKLF
ncbi:MAG: aldehyde dehydrogenase family protein [Acidobacteria bacterium]|nr:aldehyde dehydrogenase family protein [Acidobacteriota bacterium]